MSYWAVRVRRSCPRRVQAYSFIAWRSFERSFCSCDISNIRFGAFSAFQRHHFAIFDAAVCIVRSARARIIASAIGAARDASAVPVVVQGSVDDDRLPDLHLCWLRRLLAMRRLRRQVAAAAAGEVAAAAEPAVAVAAAAVAVAAARRRVQGVVRGPVDDRRGADVHVPQVQGVHAVRRVRGVAAAARRNRLPELVRGAVDRMRRARRPGLPALRGPGVPFQRLQAVR